MIPKGRAVGLLLGVIALVALGASGVLYMGQTKERQLRVATEQQLARVTAERDDLTEQVQTVKQAKDAVEDELGRTKVRLDQTAKQLAEELASKEVLARSIDERQEEITRLTKDLQQIRTERSSLESEVSKLKSNHDQLEQQLAQVQKEKEDLETRAARPSVELEPVVVGSSGLSGSYSAGAPAMTPMSMDVAPQAAFDENLQFINATASAPSAGQVLVVNREYDFVVVNLGRNQGLQVGQEFQIFRGPDVLGHVKVEKVYDELSAAAILPQSQKDKIREGDQVKSM